MICARTIGLEDLGGYLARRRGVARKLAAEATDPPQADAPAAPPSPCAGSDASGRALSSVFFVK